MENYEDKVREIIVEQLGVTPEQVVPEASFIDDLGADPLDTVELVMAFEDAFSLEIPDEDAEKLQRVGDAIEYLKKKLAEKAMPDRCRGSTRRGARHRAERTAMNRRVAVTGCGVLSPVGNDQTSFWSSLTDGTGRHRPITRFAPESFDTRIAGEVKDFDASRFIDRKVLRHTDRFVQYAWVAALEAYRNAGLSESQVDPNRFAVIIGSGIGGINDVRGAAQVLLERGPSRISPFFVPMMISDMASGQISIVFGARGPNFAHRFGVRLGRARDRRRVSHDPMDAPISRSRAAASRR